MTQMTVPLENKATNNGASLVSLQLNAYIDLCRIKCVSTRCASRSCASWTETNLFQLLQQWSEAWLDGTWRRQWTCWEKACSRWWAGLRLNKVPFVNKASYQKNEEVSTIIMERGGGTGCKEAGDVRPAAARLSRARIDSSGRLKQLAIMTVW